MNSGIRLFLSVLVGILFGYASAECQDDDTCLEALRESIGSLKRPVSPGVRRVMTYRTRKVILTPRGLDTLISRSELSLTSQSLRLVTEGLEIATDQRTTVVVFPEQRIMSVTDADTTKNAVGDRLESMGLLQDSLLRRAHQTICGDTMLGDGRERRYVSLRFSDSEASLFTCSDITLCMDSTGGPARIALRYRPGAAYLSVEIEFLSMEEREMEAKEVADVEGAYFLSRREIRPEFREYKVVDQRKRLSAKVR